MKAKSKPRTKSIRDTQVTTDGRKITAWVSVEDKIRMEFVYLKAKWNITDQLREGLRLVHEHNFNELLQSSEYEIFAEKRRRELESMGSPKAGTKGN